MKVTKGLSRIAATAQLGIQIVAAVALVFSPQTALAYDHPLSDDAVREAYFLGQDVKDVHIFLSSYVRSLPVPESGPDVAEIEVETPFAQVVKDSSQRTVNYSAQDAAAAYRKRGDYIEIRVKVLFTPSYNNAGVAFWRDVSVGIIQKEHLAATGGSGEPIYSSSDDGTALLGANVYARFNVADVSSGAAQVEVALPQGPTVQASFDLGKLR